MTKKLLIILVVIGSLFAMVACSNTSADVPPRPKQATIEVTIDELNTQKNVTRDIQVVPGDTLTVILGSNASTGYNWSEQAQISDAAVLEQTGHRYVEPDMATPLAGASGKEEWTFKVLRAGMATVAMDYSRPWQGGEQDTWTFKLNVTVE